MQKKLKQIKKSVTGDLSGSSRSFYYSKMGVTPHQLPTTLPQMLPRTGPETPVSQLRPPSATTFSKGNGTAPTQVIS